uniref:Uncharacterized protein n=2 Tax=Vitis vinifera TaxID=29760 RepID=A5AJ12_VITVI|nr:hypothetical protein VITISV_028934 [Vitis vinifera]|eukprot:XP_002275199.1 PREDICTED: uncharacterized protein LOC100241637 [Vitis vinifera]
MGHKGFLHLMIIFLGFSWLLSCAAVPSSRSFQLIKEELSAQAVFLSQKGRGFYKFPEVEEGYKRVGRIAMEGIDDYAGTGANTHHDPKPPGRV